MNIETIPPPKLRITAIMPRIAAMPNEPGPPVLTALMPTATPMIPATSVTSGRTLATRTKILLELLVTNAHARKHKALNADKIQAIVTNARAASYFPQRELVSPVHVVLLQMFEPPLIDWQLFQRPFVPFTTIPTAGRASPLTLEENMKHVVWSMLFDCSTYRSNKD